jgi:DNA-binding transcriptional MerR regulator
VFTEEIAAMATHDNQAWYTTEELAELLKIDASSIRRWRTAQPLQGPPFIRVSSRRTIYSSADVAAWLDQRRINPSAVA